MSGAGLEHIAREPAHDLYELAQGLELLSVQVTGGTDADELWVTLRSIGEQFALISGCQVTDVLEAGDRKIKWRSPRLWEYAVDYNKIRWLEESYEGVDTDIALQKAKSDWKAQHDAAPSQAGDVMTQGGSHTSWEKAVGQYEVTFSRRRDARDPMSAHLTTPATIRQRFANKIEVLSGRGHQRSGTHGGDDNQRQGQSPQGDSDQD